MIDLLIWIRVGDQDDYHSFKSPEEAAYHLHEYLHWPGHEDDGPCQCDHEIERYIGPALRGVALPGTPYTGDNGVSLYWGDKDAQLQASLTDAELEAFARTLAST